MNKTDEQYMDDFQRGDETAMQPIFQNNKQRIFHFCYGILNNRADAEEVAGDVFLTLMQKKHLYDSKRTFSTWIYTVARNKCLNRIRRRKQSISMWFQNTAKDSYDSWDVPDKGEDSRESLAKRERGLQVRRAIAGLPLEQREAVELRQYHEFSYAQISEILDCSLEKVKILIFRAKENLRVELASYIEEGQS